MICPHCHADTDDVPLAFTAQGLPKDWSTARWGSPEALAALYNERAPDNVPAVETLSPKRRERARKMLKSFPEKHWWEQVFQEYRRSKFLSGRVAPSNGHARFRPDWDWLMSTAQGGSVENAVKVHDGAFAD